MSSAAIRAANAQELREVATFVDVCVSELSKSETDGNDDEHAATAPNPLISHLVTDVVGRHRELEALATRMSQSATRLTVLLKPPAADVDLRPLLEEMRAGAIALVHIYRVIPRAEGKAYRGELQGATLSLLAGMAELANTYLDKPETFDNVPAYLFNTGMVWKAAEVFAKLPKNNREATIRVWENRQVMVEDAIGELETLLADSDANNSEPSERFQDDFDEDEEDSQTVLNASERETVKLGLGMVRLIRLLGKKLCLRLIEPLVLPLDAKTVSWLDEVVHSIEQSTKAVDEFSVALYPRHDQNSVQTHAASVATFSRSLLDFAASAPTLQLSDADKDWFSKMSGHLNSAMAKLVPSQPAR